MNDIKLLGEDDFYDVMKGTVQPWIKSTVKSGYFESYDFTEIHYYYAIPENPRGIIVMVHGFCEFFGKYHEMAWYFYQLGYAFFFPELRGHGKSGGKLPEKDLVFVKHYEQYVIDVALFLEKVVDKVADRKLKRVLFAHSMGGAVAALFLEEYPNKFDGAILSSPMLMMNTGGMSNFVINLIHLYVIIFHRWKKLSVGQKHFDGVNIFDHSSCQSRVRYDYMFDMRCKDSDYQTYGGTYAWVLASLATDKLILQDAKKASPTPIFIFEAGKDHLVDKRGYEIFTSRDKNVRTYCFETSKHEIFNATEDVRKEYYRMVFELLDEYMGDSNE